MTLAAVASFAPSSVLAATGGAANSGKVLVSILVILVAAKLAAELAERVGIPAVAGEIVAGIAIGPSVLGLVETNEILSVLGEIGVILLLLEVGIHMDLRELRSVGRSALSVAVVGVVLPLLGGLAAGSLLGLTFNQSLFIGAALTATSVGITARVFGDLRALATRESQTVLGAAVADDVIGLVVLTVVVRLVTTGEISAASVASILGFAMLFLVVCTAVGLAVVPKALEFIDKRARSNSTLFAFALAFALGVSQLATIAKLAPIIGAFVGGMALGRSPMASRIQRELTPLGHFFIPVFFLSIGIQVDVKSFASLDVLGMSAGLIVVAVLGKVVAGWAAPGPRSSKLLIGIGMIPRGEVGLIFAAIGLREGVFDDRLYAVLLLTVLVTTLMTPPLLSRQLKRCRRDDVPVDNIAAEPLEGWLRTHRGMVELAATPPAEAMVAIALESARAVDESVPGPVLVAWIARHCSGDAASGAPGSAGSAGRLSLRRRWTEAETALFLSFVREATPRSWRFLETTGFLAHSLPELERFLKGRQSNPSFLDAAGLHNWPVLEKIGRLESGVTDQPGDAGLAHRYNRLLHRERVLLAALLIDAVGDEPEPLRNARLLLDRLALDDDTRDAVAMLVSERELLRAAALRPDGLREESVMSIAAHLDTEENAEALYVLSMAMNALEDWERARINELDVLVRATLVSTAFAGAEGSSIDQRRAEAIALLPRSDSFLIERVRHAPPMYVLNSDATTIARQVKLLGNAPLRNSFVVAVFPAFESGEEFHTVEIGGRDQLGLLARTTGAMAALGLDITDALLATWGDGVALQVFRALGPVPSVIDVERLLAEPSALSTTGVADASITFDEHASPWHTVGEVRATDRRGLLHSLAVTFAVVGVDVHAARISTTDEMANDVFDLTDRSGNKLSRDLQLAVRDGLRTGVTGRRRHIRPKMNRFGTHTKH